MGKLGAALIPNERARHDPLQRRRAGDGRLRHGPRVSSASAEEARRSRVIANETRPYLQGARLTAWELVQEGIPVTLITDSMAGHLMSQRRGRRDRGRRGPHRRQRRHREQDRHLRARRAGEAPRHPVLRRRAAVDLRPRRSPTARQIPIEERPARRGHRLSRQPLGARRRRGAQSGLRRHAGGTDHGHHHRARGREEAEPRSASRSPR